MVTPIGSLGGGRPVDQLRTDAARAGTAARAADADAPAAPTNVAPNAAAAADLAPANPAKAMAAAGAPIDTARVAALKAAIAGGSYKLDPQAIADRMIALDLPARA